MSQPTPIEESHQLISRLERIEHMLRVCLGALKHEKIAENESVETVLSIAAFEAFELIEEQRENVFKLEAEAFSDEMQGEQA